MGNLCLKSQCYEFPIFKKKKKEHIRIRKIKSEANLEKSSNNNDFGYSSYQYFNNKWILIKNNNNKFNYHKIPFGN